MKIEQLSVNGLAASLLLTDEDGKQYTLHDSPCAGKLEVCNAEGGETIESYENIRDALKSHFLPGFMLMEDFKERYFRFIPVDIRDRIESSRSFHVETGTKYAADEFTANGILRTAFDAKRETDGVPECMYEIYDQDGKLMETYGLLSFALSSPYYPVLAELDAYIDEQEAEEE